MIYTRHLYDKCCVEYSLFVSLLQENKEEALFWSLELFHSGFSEELIILIWKHYYTLYAPFYINIETFLFKYTNLWIKNNCNDGYIATMINSLCSCNASIDFYFIYKNCISPPKCYEIVFKNIDDSNNIGDIMKITDECIMKYKLFKNRGKDKISYINTIFETFTFLNIDIYKFAIKSRLISGLFLLNKNNKFDPKGLYTIKKQKDIAHYKTKPVVELKGWKIPRRECIYQLKLKPTTILKDISNYDNWLYYASKSPIWYKRICKYNGVVDHTQKIVIFDNIDNEEKFYNMYNYEPDEQPLDVQLKWMGKKEHDTWEHIYDKYKCEPYNEWLNETNN